MKTSRFAFAFFAATLLLATGCANGPCRQLRHPELATSAATAPGEAPAASTPTTTPGVKASPTGAAVNDTSSTKETTILVFKADGSLQCGAAKGVSPTEMEKQLSGIKVFSRDKRPDGLMHMQVCGSPTGIINVFEIPASALQDAESRGFKKLEPR